MMSVTVPMVVVVGGGAGSPGLIANNGGYEQTLGGVCLVSSLTVLRVRPSLISGTRWWVLRLTDSWPACDPPIDHVLITDRVVDV
jgi:hypothetical protein